jgi:hypothetical protein
VPTNDSPTIKEQVDHLKACIDLSNEIADDLNYSKQLAIHRRDQSLGNGTNIPLAPLKTRTSLRDREALVNDNQP